MELTSESMTVFVFLPYCGTQTASDSANLKQWQKSFQKFVQFAFDVLTGISGPRQVSQ